ARICTAGRGGAVLLSETTRALLGSGLPEGVAVFPLGERRLKGLAEPEGIYELAIEDVEVAPETAPQPAEKAGARDPGAREGAFERRAAALRSGGQHAELT